MRTILIKERMVFRILILAVAVAVLGSACGDRGDQNGGLPLVIATTTILGDIVAQTAGEAVEVEILMPVDADPHVFAPSARQAARLREAALVVANGVGLEESLLDVIESASEDGVAVMLVGELLDPRPFVGSGDNQAVGEDDPGLDPHVWMDPIRMADAVELIADRLRIELSVDVSDTAAIYRAQILELDAEIKSLIGVVAPDRRKLVTNHFSLGYYADRYGLTMLGTVIPAAGTGANTSAAGFAHLIEVLEREDVSVVFGSTTEPTTLAVALAAEIGHQVRVIELYTGSLGEVGSGADTYVDMMRTNTRLIIENL
jgi:zinc/manganese transport system substrate-binding protein